MASLYDFSQAISKLNKEDLDFARINASPDWKPILKYLQARIASCNDEMLRKPLDGGDLQRHAVRGRQLASVRTGAPDQL